jgi:hypothetical protein
MSAEIYKVTAAPGPNSPKSMQEALQLAEKTGRLAIPGEALCLTVSGGKIEVIHAEKK